MKHYKTKHKETIEIIRDFLSDEAFEGYLLGNCIKYRERYNNKGEPISDILKMLDYWHFWKHNEWIDDSVRDALELSIYVQYHDATPERQENFPYWFKEKYFDMYFDKSVLEKR